MKRKLALLLAAVMTIAAAPTTLFAASTNQVIKQMNLENKTLVYEQDWAVSGGKTTGDISSNSDIEYWQDGTYLRIRMTDSDMKKGDSFRATLTNAKWYFRSTVATTLDFNTRVNAYALGTAAAGETGTTVLALPTFESVDAGADGGAVPDTSVMPNLTAAEVVAINKAKIALINKIVAEYSTLYNKTLAPAAITADAGVGYEVAPQAIAITGSIQVGDLTPGSNGFPNVTSTYNPNDGVMTYVNNNYHYQRVEGTATSQGFVQHVGYKLSITDAADKQIYVTLTQDADKDSYISIPLVMLTTAEGDFTIRVESGSNVSSGNNSVASTVTGRTKASIASVVTSRTDFALKKLTIEETKAGSFKAVGGKFELRAPSGYYWANPKNVKIYAQSGLAWSNGSTGLVPDYADGTTGATASDYAEIAYKTGKGSNDDDSILVVTLGDTTTAPNKGITPSQATSGAIWFDGLRLVADDEDKVTPDEELVITLKDTGSKRNITDQSLTVGKVADYTITLTRVKDEIPTLISGRLDGQVDYYGETKKYDDNINDKEHLAAKVKFAEKVNSAWWAERSTKLYLPEEVTAMKVKFTEVKELVATSKTELLAGTNNDNDGVYYNIRKKSGQVTIKNNEITLTGLSIINTAKTEKASFELELWLSIQADFDNDIDLTLDKSALRDSTDAEDVSVTIAKAVRPIEVNTKVTEAKIGYQYVTVADFDIVENIAGGLLYGEDVYISVTDEISIDMAIAKGFTTEVTDGNIKISSIKTGSVLSTWEGATDFGVANIRFTVDRESTKASTISFKNVQVKIDRSVPYSNTSTADDRGIKLVVWGPAVANNYYYLQHTNASSETGSFFNDNDTFGCVGISAKYINIATLANDTNSEFQNVVTATIGNPVATVNGADVTLPVAPYVSAASNSTMIPLRFISVALGLGEEKVKWDAKNGTVTIDAGSRLVQFQVGNTNYLVNGVSIPMTSTDGLPVACEINSERSFVPFRALGEAFNIKVDWDGATATATYNAPTK